jgi:hypothetical protein
LKALITGKTFARRRLRRSVGCLAAAVGLGACLCGSLLHAEPVTQVALMGDRTRVSWSRQQDGWHVVSVQTKHGGAWQRLPSPSGLYTLIYDEGTPRSELVGLDKEGEGLAFYPSSVQQRPDGGLVFEQDLPLGKLTAEWRIDPVFATDVDVTIRFTASRKGNFSLVSPTLAVFDPRNVTWGTVPGNWYGTGVQPNFELSPHYSQGIPARPYLVGERNSMTLSPILSEKGGISVGVIPDPGTAADPWEKDKSTRDKWKVGLSTMDRYSQLTPVIYHPVLGQDGSHLDVGGTTALSFRYSIEVAPWFAIFRHAVEDIYRFNDLLTLQRSTMSLSDRVNRITTMLKNDQESRWKVVAFHGAEIGANGEKTSDVAAMYMLARTTQDPILNARLPYLRSYKFSQQQMAPGFFQYAATGEYPRDGSFVSEKGAWVEPLFTTYYTMLDMGNMALFDPGDKELRERLRLGAEKLMEWQHPDGSWDVGYDKRSHLLTFPQLTDLRPTWYGLLVAARVLKDPRYLAAARKGADWYLTNAVAPGHYLGACGDALDLWDFTTIFGSQALLDLFDATGDRRYRDAAIEIARVYATTIFTHPIPSTVTKMVAGVPHPDWEMSQVGLSVEHIRGTATGGPILLSSHAGLFVRMFELTGEQLFLDMARAAARGRQEFLDPETGVSVYYWNTLDRVAKESMAFPWHAEWQVGWITDYLLSEAHLRSGGQVSFPHGFPTPKVGSHVTYGFAPGRVYGHEATLLLGDGAVTADTSNAEYLYVLSTDRASLYVMVLNQMPAAQEVTLHLDPNRLAGVKDTRWTTFSPLNKDGFLGADPVAGTLRFKLEPWGFNMVTLGLKKD